MLSNFSLAYEISGEPWRARAYKQAASLIDATDHGGSYVVSLKAPERTPGIGSSIGKTIREFGKKRQQPGLGNGATLALPEHVDPEKVRAYQRFIGVLGVGHKLALYLVSKGLTQPRQLLDPRSVDGDPVIHSVMGGTEGGKNRGHLVRLGVIHYADLNARIPRRAARKLVEALTRCVTSVYGEDTVPPEDVLPLGSYRRGARDVGDIDLLVDRRVSLEKLAQRLPACIQKDKMKNKTPVLAEYVDTVVRGERKFSFLVKHTYSKQGGDGTHTNKQVYVHKVSRVDVFAMHHPEEKVTFIMHATGSALHNEHLRQVAKKRGYLLNEYGLFDTRGVTKKRVPVSSEKQVYALLGLAYIPPEHR